MSSNSRSTATDAKPSHEQIAVRAELLWKAKGSPEGRDEEIWLEAERQLFDEAREIISAPETSHSSEEPNPAMGQKSSAAEEMSAPSSPPARSGKRRSSGR